MSTLRVLRAFTLIELIVVILVLGILAAVGVIGYAEMTDRAQAARARADLRQLTAAVLADLSATDADLTRSAVRDALSDAGLDVADGITAAGWELGTAEQSPHRAQQAAVGFDNDDHAPNDIGGSRAALVVGADIGGPVFAVVLTAGGQVSEAVQAQAGTTPADLLGATQGTNAPVLSNDDVFVPLPTQPTPSPSTDPVVVPGVPVVQAAVDGATFTASWAPVADATAYVVAVRTDGGTWVEQSQVEHSFTGPIAAGSTVTVRVKSLAQATASPWSDEQNLTRAPGAVTLSGTRSTTTAALSWTAANGATEYTLTRSSTTASLGTLNSPEGMAVDADGTIFIADKNSNRIRKLTASGLTTYAGTGAAGASDGDRLSATFNGPSALALDSAGNLFVTDTYNHRIRKITPDGVVSTFAGGAGGFVNATGTAAKFYYPQALAFDTAGTLYVSDTNNNCIRKVTPTAVVSTFAGSCGTSGLVNATGTNARFAAPRGLVVNAAGTTMYVADMGNATIRQISVSSAAVSSLAGANGATPLSGYVDGAGSTARFYNPVGLAIDGAGNIVVADRGNNRIRRVTPTGVVTTVSGTGAGSSVDGSQSSATFNSPSGVAVKVDGTVVVSEVLGNRIRTISGGQVSTVAGTGAAGAEDGATVTTPEVEVYRGPGLSFNDSGLVSGTSYAYRVTARNSAGSGPVSGTRTLS